LEQHGTVLIDQLGFLSRIEMSRLASILLHLEFNGWVKSLPGKKYTLS
jgi:DNA processing protein